MWFFFFRWERHELYRLFKEGNPIRKSVVSIRPIALGQGSHNFQDGACRDRAENSCKLLIYTEAFAVGISTACKVASHLRGRLKRFPPPLKNRIWKWKKLDSACPSVLKGSKQREVNRSLYPKNTPEGQSAEGWMRAAGGKAQKKAFSCSVSVLPLLI